MAAEPNAQGPEIYYPLGLGEECGDGILRIKPDRYEEVESGCRYTELKTWFDATIPVATKTKPGVYVSRVTAKCTGEGDKWREQATVLLLKRHTVQQSSRCDPSSCPSRRPSGSWRDDEHSSDRDRSRK
jgi:hypothetical protein